MKVRSAAPLRILQGREEAREDLCALQDQSQTQTAPRFHHASLQHPALHVSRSSYFHSFSFTGSPHKHQAMCQIYTARFFLHYFVWRLEKALTL